MISISLRLVFGQNNELYVTVGERSDATPRVQAQDLSSGLKKVFRIDAEGKAFEGNPFAGQQNAPPEIWSYGHRVTSSRQYRWTGRLWTGTWPERRRRDELRRRRGLNYGWPVNTYGVEYSGRSGEGATAKEGMERRFIIGTPVIGPSGMAFYDADRI